MHLNVLNPINVLIWVTFQNLISLTEAWVIIQENGVICERYCFLPQHNQRIPVRAASEAIRSLKRQPLKKMAERSKKENELLEQQQLRAQREEALLYAWVEQAHREGHVATFLCQVNCSSTTQCSSWGGLDAKR